MKFRVQLKDPDTLSDAIADSVDAEVDAMGLAARKRCPSVSSSGERCVLAQEHLGHHRILVDQGNKKEMMYPWNQ